MIKKIVNIQKLQTFDFFHINIGSMVEKKIYRVSSIQRNYKPDATNGIQAQCTFMATINNDDNENDMVPTVYQSGMTHVRTSSLTMLPWTPRKARRPATEWWTRMAFL